MRSDRSALRAPPRRAVRRRPRAAAELDARVRGPREAAVGVPDPRLGRTRSELRAGRAGCGTAGAWSPPPRSTSSTPGARSRRRATAGGPCGLGRGGRAVAVERAGVLPHGVCASGARSGSRATTADDPGVPVPAAESERAGDVMLERCRPAPFLRRVFAVRGPVRRAMLYATARGLVEMHLNGARVGDAVLAPGLDGLPQAHRVRRARRDRPARRRRRTCSAAILGDGWYAGFVGMDLKRAGAHYGTHPELLCELHLEYADGVVARWWRATSAGARPPGRSATRTCCTASTTTPAASSTAGRIRATTTAPGGRGADAGARRRGAGARARAADPRDRGAAAGVRDRARARRPRGRPRTEHGRLGPPAGRGRDAARPCGCGSPRCSRRTARCTWRTCARRGRRRRTSCAAADREVFEPRFTFHGFRYVEVQGPAEPPALVGRVVHSDTPWTGRFECSSDLVNQLWRNVAWGQRGNFLSVPDRLPAARRAARLARPTRRSSCPSAALNMDVAAFITKWGDDILDAQSRRRRVPGRRAPARRRA